MAKIENPGLHPIALPTRHVVPARGVLDTTNAVIADIDNAPMLGGLVRSGAITVTLDPEPEEPGPVTAEPEVVAPMEEPNAATDAAPKAKK